MKEELQALLKDWTKARDLYAKQSLELLKNNLNNDCHVGMITGFRTCVHDLELLLKRHS